MMSQKCSVLIHQPDGLTNTLSAPLHEAIIDQLPALLQNTVSVHIRESVFSFQSNVSFKTHVFVARERSYSTSEACPCVLDVYAISIEDIKEDITKSRDEVFNHLISTYPRGEFSIEDKESLTAYYQCDTSGGCIFTIRSPDAPILSNSSSNSYSDDDIIRCPSDLLNHPPRPLGLSVPTPAMHNNDNNQSRKTEMSVDVQSPLIQHKLDQQKFPGMMGHTGRVPVILNDAEVDYVLSVPGINPEIASSPMQGEDEAISPSEESSVSSEENNLSNSKSALMFGTKNLPTSGSNMVVGLLPRPVSLGSMLRSHSSVQISHAFSDGITEEVRQEDSVLNSIQGKPPFHPILMRSFSEPATPVQDSARNLCQKSPNSSGKKLPAIERENSGEKNEMVLGIGDKNMREQWKVRSLLPSPPNMDVTNLSDTKEADETHLLAEGNQKNRDRLVPINEEIDDSIPVQPSELLEKEEEPLTFEVSHKHHREELELVTTVVKDTPQSTPGKENVQEKKNKKEEDNGESLKDVGEGHESQEEEGGDDDDEDKEPSDSSSDGSEGDVIDKMTMDQVHLLEHACNDTCCLDECPSRENPEFIEKVKQMVFLVEKMREDGYISEEMKRYIRIHCSRRCQGSGCKVPHQAAGCLPPSPPTTTTLSQNHSPLRSPVGISHISFDMECANDSTTPDMGNTNDTGNKEVRNQTPPPPNDLRLTPGHGNALYHHHVQLPTPTPQKNVLQTSNMAFGGYKSPETRQRTDDFRVHTPHPLNHNFLEKQSNYKGQAHQRQAHQRQAHQWPNYQGQAQQRPNYQDQLHQQANSDYGGHPQHYIHPQAFSPNYQGQPHLQQVSTPQRDLGVYCKIDPLDIARHRRTLQQPGAQYVWTEGETFPLYNEFDKYGMLNPGTIVYSSEDMKENLIAGLVYPIPSFQERDRLGKGGNGSVFTHYINGIGFAVKKYLKNGYRCAELNLWVQLKHPNVMPLLAVMIDKPLSSYQFMPKMTDNLSRVIDKVGYLEKLLKEGDPDTGTVSSNMMYDIKSVLKALEYLESLNIQHCDVKGSNILIRKICKCQDAFHCMCPETEKYQVMLTDFDSAKQTLHRRLAKDIPNVECDPMPMEKRKSVLGTPAYRAQEQFHQPKRLDPHLEKELTWHGSKKVQDLEGPWCDVHSMGVVIERMCIGRETIEDRHNANILIDAPDKKDLNLSNESLLAHLRLKYFFKAAADYAVLKSFAILAEYCLKPDFRTRLTAHELLEKCEGFNL